MCRVYVARHDEDDRRTRRAITKRVIYCCCTALPLHQLSGGNHANHEFEVAQSSLVNMCRTNLERTLCMYPEGSLALRVHIAVCAGVISGPHVRLYYSTAGTAAGCCGDSPFWDFWQQAVHMRSLPERTCCLEPQYDTKVFELEFRDRSTLAIETNVVRVVGRRMVFPFVTTSCQRRGTLEISDRRTCHNPTPCLLA